MDIMQHSACMVINQITVYSYDLLFNDMMEDHALDCMSTLTLNFHRWVGACTN